VRDRIELDGLLRKSDMELKYNTQIQSAEINAALNKDREVIRQEGALIQAVANQPPQPMM
jgi:transcriptional regulator of NAD metabolism